MVDHKPARKRSRSTKTKRDKPEARKIEGASLATLDIFMKMIGEESTAELMKPKPDGNSDFGNRTPLSVKALDFVGIVFGKP